MHKLRLVLALVFVWFSWQSWFLPATADGPSTPLPDETTPQQLIIPSINLNTTIVPVGIGAVVVNGQEYPIWNTAENNVGWHQGSGPPGQIGNTVLAGHSNGGREIFRRLEELEVEEDIFVATNKGWHRYRVAEKLILREQGEPVEVRAANAHWILPTADERLTLITCWPYPVSTHRLLIIAHPVSREAPPSNLPNIQVAPEPEPILTLQSESETALGLQPEPSSKTIFNLLPQLPDQIPDLHPRQFRIHQPKPLSQSVNRHIQDLIRVHRLTNIMN